MMPTREDACLLVPAGNTVVLQDGGASSSPVLLVLVVGDGPASRGWLRLLAAAGPPAMRHWMTRADLDTVSPHLHVQPTVTPCFLVFRQGWPVDWFPAPLPRPGEPEAALLMLVRSRMAQYGAPPR